MAIVLKEELKGEIGLIVAALCLVILLFFLAKNLITKVLPEEKYVPKPLNEIKINKTVLENELLENLLPLETINPAEKIGRENPFLPY